jgi:adenylate cyclase class 1
MQTPVSIDDDIDRKALRALREQFLRRNVQRIESLRARLTNDQRTFLDALPVLLHSNHAALPGYVAFDTPCGIERYTPARTASNAARQLALSFTHERFVERRAQILAVYVCPDDDNPAAIALCVCSPQSTHAALDAKLERIVRVAADYGLQLAPTLLDQHAADAPLPATATPLLARDTFYRSAMLLAGRYPIWWLVPPQLDDQYDAYCTRLKSQRYIGRDETVDLGPLHRIAVGECVTAGVDALDAALRAPYPHLALLMLLEAYACDAAPLAQRCKRRIWDGEDDVDAALLQHEAIETYLTERGETERRDLARRSLLACQADSAALRTTIAAWHWSDETVRRARGERDLTIAELKHENSCVNAELQRAYQALLSRCPAAALDTLARLKELGARINRLIVQPAGTLPRLNSALLPKRLSGRVRVEPHNGGWRLHDGSATIYAAPRLATLIAWAHLHRLGSDNLQISDADYRRCCARMLEFFARHAADLVSTCAQLWLINAQELPSVKAAGDALVSDWDDPLDYSGFHTNLVAGIDMLDVAADGIRGRSAAGDDGLLETLTSHLSASAAPMYLACVGGERSHAIEARLNALVTQLEAFAHAADAGRFVFSLAGGFVVVERIGAAFSSRRCADEAQLLAMLSVPALNQSIRVDAHSTALNALAQLCRLASPKHDTLLVHEQRAVVRVWLSAADGDIHLFDAPHLTALEVANELHSFVARHHEVRRNTATRAACIYVGRGNDVAATTLFSRSEREHGSIANVAAGTLRRSLAAALRERFPLDPESARRSVRT